MKSKLRNACGFVLFISFSFLPHLIFAGDPAGDPHGDSPPHSIYNLDNAHFSSSGVRSLHTAEISVHGKVTDESNQPLPGVNILVKGTTNGTTSDANGDYSLTVTDKNSVLVFSFIGYATQEVSIDKLTSINITLKEELISLSEVEVTGYESQS